jgi:hypothetical protein
VSRQAFSKLFSVVDLSGRLDFLNHHPADNLLNVTTFQTVKLFFLFHILINNWFTGIKIFPKVFDCLDGSLKVNLKEFPGMALIGVPAELLKVTMDQVFNLIVISDRESKP